MAHTPEQEALDLAQAAIGDPAEQRVLAFCAAVVRDSQDEDTLRAAIHIAAAALKQLRRRRGQSA